MPRVAVLLYVEQRAARTSAAGQCRRGRPGPSSPRERRQARDADDDQQQRPGRPTMTTAGPAARGLRVAARVPRTRSATSEPADGARRRPTPCATRRSASPRQAGRRRSWSACLGPAVGRRPPRRPAACPRPGRRRPGQRRRSPARRPRRPNDRRRRPERRRRRAGWSSGRGLAQPGELVGERLLGVEHGPTADLARRRRGWPGGGPAGGRIDRVRVGVVAQVGAAGRPSGAGEQVAQRRPGPGRRSSGGPAPCPAGPTAPAAAGRPGGPGGAPPRRRRAWSRTGRPGRTAARPRPPCRASRRARTGRSAARTRRRPPARVR